jgi:hypothetical protein
MSKKNKIILAVLIVLIIGGFGFMQWQKSNKPTIDAKVVDADKKEIEFEMSYKDMKFDGSIKLGGIRRQVLQEHTFEAFSLSNEIVLHIKAPDNSILLVKKIAFNA